MSLLDKKRKTLNVIDVAIIIKLMCFRLYMARTFPHTYPKILIIQEVPKNFTYRIC